MAEADDKNTLENQDVSEDENIDFDNDNDVNDDEIKNGFVDIDENDKDSLEDIVPEKDEVHDDIAKKMANIIGKVSQHEKDSSSYVDQIIKKQSQFIKEKKIEENEVKPIITPTSVIEEEPKKSEEKAKSSVAISEYIEKKYQKILQEHFDKIPPSEFKEAQEILLHFSQSESDINRLKSGEILEPKAIVSNFEKDLMDYEKMLNTIDKVEDINIYGLRVFIKSLLKKIGPNQDTSLLLMNLLSYKNTQSYLTTHSINVTIFSLIIAIEMSRLMQSKANSPESKNNLNYIKILDKKIFTEADLIDLGVAGLLHDIYIKRVFPELKANTLLKFRDHLEYKRHPSEGYHFIKKFNLGFLIENAILQHHERFDGKGYPDGIHENVFGKYSRVLSFADRYESLANTNPFIPSVSSGYALGKIIKFEKQGFDKDVILAFLKATSLYPLGSFVMTNSNHISIVCEVNTQNVQKPTIQLLFDELLNSIIDENVRIDLNVNNTYQIVKAVHPKDIKHLLDHVHEKLIFSHG